MKKALEVQSSKGKSFFNKAIRIIIPLILGVVILYFLYRGTNFDEMWSIIKDANYGIIAFSLIFGLLGNVIRGMRWKLLIKPLGYTPRSSTLIYAVLGNYAVNFLLPRAGEVWRCGIVAKDEKIPFAKLFGTMIIDRVFDTLAVLVIVLFALIFNIEFFVSYLEQNVEQNAQLMISVTAFFSSKLFYSSLVAVIVFFVLIFTVFKKNVIVVKTKHFLKGIARDMRAVWRMKQKTRFFVYTVGIWLSYFLYFYITFFAFGFTQDLGITAGLIAFAVSSVSMGIPTNGGVGAWHIAVIAALTLYAVDYESARAFATAVFAIQSLWVILCGVFGILALGVKEKK